jgi:hypothetical protein
VISTAEQGSRDITQGETAAVEEFLPVLNLKDAKIMSPLVTGHPPDVYMRVRLASVDAWTLGEMMTSRTPSG